MKFVGILDISTIATFEFTAKLLRAHTRTPAPQDSNYSVMVIPLSLHIKIIIMG